MKRQWQIRRTLLASTDGQQRWDRAYQQALSWPSPGPPLRLSAASSEQEMEGEDARSDLCASIDPAAGADADD